VANSSIGATAKVTCNTAKESTPNRLPQQFLILSAPLDRGLSFLRDFAAVEEF